MAIPPLFQIGVIVLSRFAGSPNCTQALLPGARRHTVSSKARPNTSDSEPSGPPVRSEATAWNWSLGVPKGCHPLQWSRSYTGAEFLQTVLSSEQTPLASLA